jgi:predicted enzyme related to lactoylglutathione lyase
MTEFKSYPPGTFCWVDLGTTDGAAAKKFYGTLFGWSAEDMPAGPDMVYTMCNLKGKNVGALYEQGDDQRKAGVPPNWLSYVSVASADESTAKAKSLGGKVMKEPFDVMDVGRMSVLQDPTGATFALWQPRRHFGAQLANEPGTFTWNELLTHDPESAKKFYQGLFGWGVQSMEMGGPESYTIFQNGERGAGGMMRIAKEWGPVPPNWLVYFAVDDCDGTVKKAEKLGGQVRAQPMDIPEVGRFAPLGDPQGAGFAVIKLANPQS